jgi:predicted DNA repair protein MutK
MLMVAALPWVIKTLGVVGTAALLLVSGGIFHHHLPRVHEAMHAWPGLVTDAVLGLVGGAAVMLVVTGGKRLCARMQ